MIYRAAILSILILAISCSSTPPVVPYDEVKARFNPQLIDRNEVVLKLIYACKDDMPYETRDCKIKKKQIDVALKVVAELNKEADSLVISSNAKVEQLIECTYQGYLKDQKTALIEAQAARNQLFSMGKQIISYAGCAALLGLGL